MRRRSAATNARVEADGSVDAQNAPTDPCKTTERFCTSSHTLHRRFPFQKNPRPEPLRISGQLPTDSAEEARKGRDARRGTWPKSRSSGLAIARKYSNAG